MFCHQCGSGVSDGAASCGSCGADLRSRTQGDTQPIQAAAAPDATIRMAAPTGTPDAGQAAGASPAAPSKELPTTAVMAAVGTPTTDKPPASSAPSSVSKTSAPLVLLFGAAVLLGVAGWGAYQWSVGRSEARAAAASVAAATTAAANTANAASNAVAAATSSAADAVAAVTPAAAPVEPPAADPVTAAPAATAAAQPATGPGSGPALLAAARKERDAAIAQRDAALEQIKQLNSDLTHARAAASAAPAPVVAPVASADTARLTQLQKEHDTVRYVAGSRKQLLADKVIESHLYLLPPPANLTQITLSQTTEITLDAKSYGLNNVKDVVVIPSSVWENTDYKISNTGSTVTFTILRPDAFRTFARYFVLMLE
jgi:hypothetical protein